ncbi:MAG: hypothetical protein ABSF92_00440 [Candidatus Acidiferrales bacterium]|jgi:hypothetical protein
MNNAILAEAFARLNAVRGNLPDSLVIHEKYVNEFHDILDLLTKETGTDLSRFRVPASELKRTPTSFTPGRGTRYSEAKYCDRQFLLIKIDSVLGFFKLQTAKSEIGFHAP